ncbi:MAG: protein kinase [Pseudomonadota bacterium]
MIFIKTKQKIGLLLSFVSVCAHAAGDEVPKLNGFELNRVDEIGRGSFGSVYRGYWRAGGVDVAIKVLNIPTITEAEKREFNKEVGILWQSQFQRVVRLYGVCLDPGNLSMVFELMNGSLYDLLHSGTAVSNKQRSQVAIDIIQGLQDLHANHILHRDLKSHNILLDVRGRAKISDFGLAKLRLATSTRTNGRVSAGTLRWRAPEHLNLRPAALHTSMDMYSYGIILWELLTHKIPFEYQPDDTIIKDAVKGGEREEIPEDCPVVWREIINACWQQDPLKRPDAGEVLERLSEEKPERTPAPLWLFEDQTIKTIPNCGYTYCDGSATDWEFVLRCYQHHPVPGYDVDRVEVIYHPLMNQTFATSIQMLQQRKGNPRYVADWMSQRKAEWRRNILQQLGHLSEEYIDDTYPDVNVLPLWHGTQSDKLRSILSTGYTPFGDTDDGYFGKGIYMTHEASYAAKYVANGFDPTPESRLILNWVSSYSSCPIISDDFDPSEKKMILPIRAGKYDSHFIPVVSQNPADPICMEYIPTGVGEQHHYTEMVIFEKAHILPRYVVTLKESLGIDSQQSVMREALREREERARKREALGKDRRSIKEVDNLSQRIAAENNLLEEKRQLDLEKEILVQQQQALEVFRQRAEDERRLSEERRREDELRLDEENNMLDLKRDTLGQQERELEALRQRLNEEQEEKKRLSEEQILATDNRCLEEERRLDLKRESLDQRAHELESLWQCAEDERRQFVLEKEIFENQRREYEKKEKIAADANVISDRATAEAKRVADAKLISDRASVATHGASGGGIVTTNVLTSPLKSISAPRVTIPEFARGYEDIYRRFIGGKLLYKPDQNSTIGQIEIPFTSLLNPLEGTFDLSRCGDVGRYISISTGYRKGKIAANKDKLEIWITPKFVVENELRTSASHYAPILNSATWTSPVGIIWTYGGWDDVAWYDYLTTKQFDEISSKNLYENWCGVFCARWRGTVVHSVPADARMSRAHRLFFTFDFN